MKLIRLKTSETVLLEDGFFWSDEFEWKPIEQKQDRAIDGTLIIQEGKKKSGRPITLIPAEDMGWIKRSVLSKLQDWSGYQSEVFQLVFDYPHDTRCFQVIFNHQDGAISNIATVKGIPASSESDQYTATIKFLEVQ
ncbi:hypothetical protein [Acinetobacter stercoris]|uniref:Phage tail protein n=1 Tax=Acinetobacter stercoris TaxID=2126983 RepID=A0A2U3MXY9_9GAMM|nr:hypothetical protein [Acinetobacter stercoris]SPL70302.1 hypothetical protein KPC_1480 [Acinetobacter stercoris]